MPPRDIAAKARPFYLGVFLLCMSILMLQIVQTRILSVAAYYYLAFLSISMGMLGMTAGALAVYFGRERFTTATLARDLTAATLAFAGSTAGCFLVQMASVAITVTWATTVVVWLKLIVLLAVPFFFAGVAVSLALTRSPFPVGVVYGVDLTGASAGCLVVLLLMNSVDAPSAVFVIAAVVASAAVCFASLDRSPAKLVSMRLPAVVAVALLVLAVGNANSKNGFQPVFGKDGIEPRADFEHERWNSFSRVVAYVSRPGKAALWGPSPIFQNDGGIEGRELNIDGFAATVMPKFSGELRSVDFLRYDITNLAYHIRHDGRAAVIGVGGGRDLLSAYLFGFRDVTGIELNEIFVDWLTDSRRLRDYAGIASLPGVRFIVDDGRSWLTRTQERFDCLQMSMIDTFAATGAGAFSLSENGLYTTEGWKVFLEALTPRGVLTVSRWHATDAPVETARVVSLALSALMAENVSRPRDHLYLASSDVLATIVVGREPLSSADVAFLDQAVDQLQFRTLIRPGSAAPEPILEDLLSAPTLEGLNRRAREYLLDVSAPTDARPFFFNQLRLSHPADIVTLLRRGAMYGLDNVGSNLVVTGNLLASGTLALLIVLSAALLLLVVILPARAAIHAVERRFVVGTTAYFVLIGLGFMFVEIGLVQRGSVFLGHPTYGLSIVLFSIILSTGIGSLFSERLSLTKRSHFSVWALALAGYLFCLPWWMPMVWQSFQLGGVALRGAIAAATIAPAGFLMGCGFPTGMRLLTATGAQSTAPWFWGVNGAAGVLAAGLAVANSIALSIDATLRVGAFCYLLLVPAWLVMTRGEVDVTRGRAVRGSVRPLSARPGASGSSPPSRSVRGEN